MQHRSPSKRATESLDLRCPGQVKKSLLELRYGASLKAEKYDAWSADAAAARASFSPKQRDVTSNAYHQLPPDFRPVVLTADGRNAMGKCFDMPYYKTVRSTIHLARSRLP